MGVKGKNKLETLRSHPPLGIYHEFVHLCMRAGPPWLALVGSPFLPNSGSPHWVSNCFKVKGGRVGLSGWGQGRGGQGRGG